MKVALDARGGDFAPQSTVQGAVEAVRELGDDLRVFLVGEEKSLKAELSHCDGPADRISIFPAD